MVQQPLEDFLSLITAESFTSNNKYLLLYICECLGLFSIVTPAFQHTSTDLMCVQSNNKMTE